MPLRLAQSFVKSKQSWIDDNIGVVGFDGFFDGMKFGIERKLRLIVGTKQTAKTYDDELIISLADPTSITMEDKSYILKEMTKLMRKDAKLVLIDMTKSLAKSHKLLVNQVVIKDMTTRWGSCSSKNNINLSLWLTEIPDNLAYHVVCHELAHLTHKHHQASFKALLNQYDSDSQSNSKELSDFSPRNFYRYLQS